MADLVRRIQRAYPQNDRGMRIAASLALLAGSLLCGCDVLFGLQDVRPPPPDVLDIDIDAAEPDAPPVAPMHCTLPASWNVTTIGDGTFYTVDASITWAVFNENSKIWLAPAGSAARTNELFATITSLRAPRLAPSGKEVFMILAQPCCSLVAAQQDASGSWSMPSAVPIVNHVIGVEEVPGVPSAGIGAKRRMIISDATTDDLFEMREDADGWNQVFAYKDQTFGMVEIQDANLSPDGYRMYFGGIKMGQTTQRVFMVERTDLTKAFEPPVTEVHDSTQSTLNIRAPYVSDDCKTLWFSLGTGLATIRKGVGT